MLRKFFISLLVVVSTLSYSHMAFAQSDEHVMPASDDRWVPWPWTLAQPFPWQNIQGLWKVEQDDFSSYFALKVVKEKTTGIKQLQIKQFDGDTCKVLATGVGVSIERNQKVLAQMTSRGGITYRVQLTAFKETDSPVPPLRGNVPMIGVMVLSMGSLDTKVADEMVHMQIMKVSDHLTQKTCLEDIKK